MVRKLKALFGRIFYNRELIFELTKRSLVESYKGQIFGALWTFIYPLVTAFLYIFLFGVIFKSNIGFSENMPLSYSSYILSGVIPWICIQSNMNSGASSIINNATIVKQVIFPVEVFPVKCLLSSVIIEGVYLGIVLIYNTLSAQKVLWTYLLLPIAIIFQMSFLLGFNYLSSSLTVYYRDIKDFIQIICMLGIYIMPVVYLPDAVPAVFRPFLYINPLSHYIWMFQDVLYFGRIEHPYAWIVCFISSFVILLCGDSIFQKLKISFGGAI